MNLLLASLAASGTRQRRHTAEVTADRLAQHIEAYYDLLDGAERDAFSKVIWILDEIASDVRSAE